MYNIERNKGLRNF